MTLVAPSPDMPESAPWSFSWSFRHMRQPAMGLYQLDGLPDLTSKDDTMRDDMDGRGSTSNP